MSLTQPHLKSEKKQRINFNHLFYLAQYSKNLISTSSQYCVKTELLYILFHTRSLKPRVYFTHAAHLDVQAPFQQPPMAIVSDSADLGFALKLKSCLSGWEPLVRSQVLGAGGRLPPLAGEIPSVGRQVHSLFLTRTGTCSRHQGGALIPQGTYPLSPLGLHLPICTMGRSPPHSLRLLPLHTPVKYAWGEALPLRTGWVRVSLAPPSKSSTGSEEAMLTQRTELQPMPTAPPPPNKSCVQRANRAT